MSTYLLLATPIHGHVAPMLTIGRRLVGRGHQVTVLTGRKYAPAAGAAGLGFSALPAEIDYDDADLDAWLPNRARYRGLAAGRHDIIEMFIRPMIKQHTALEDLLEARSFDGVVAESAFLGALPLLLRKPPSGRLPVVGISVTPLALRSVDCAPFGSGLAPGRTARTRRRNRRIDFLLHHGPLRPVQRALDGALSEVGLGPSMINYFDHVGAFDLTFQLGVRGFEYPRRELPSTVRFVGPLWSDPALPDPADTTWLAELDRSRPVVHVTQGTMANLDPSQLLAPTIRALADEDVTVVASTGGRPTSALLAQVGGQLPANARAVEFLSYDRLLPRVDLMITNGGYGGVQQALAYGLPIVVAGTTEDKPEVAARVAWTGAGINLKRDRPSPARIRRAVRAALTQPSYRHAARDLQREIVEQHDPATRIAEELEALVGGSTSESPANQPRPARHRRA